MFFPLRDCLNELSFLLILNILFFQLAFNASTENHRIMPTKLQTIRLLVWVIEWCKVKTGMGSWQTTCSILAINSKFKRKLCVTGNCYLRWQAQPLLLPLSCTLHFTSCFWIFLWIYGGSDRWSLKVISG
jgi:hypothetical protein